MAHQSLVNGSTIYFLTPPNASPRLLDRQRLPRFSRNQEASEFWNSHSRRIVRYQIISNIRHHSWPGRRIDYQAPKFDSTLRISSTLFALPPSLPFASTPSPTPADPRAETTPGGGEEEGVRVRVTHRMRSGGRGPHRPRKGASQGFRSGTPSDNSPARRQKKPSVPSSLILFRTPHQYSALTTTSKVSAYCTATSPLRRVH